MSCRYWRRYRKKSKWLKIKKTSKSSSSIITRLEKKPKSLSRWSNSWRSKVIMKSRWSKSKRKKSWKRRSKKIEIKLGKGNIRATWRCWISCGLKKQRSSRKSMKKKGWKGSFKITSSDLKLIMISRDYNRTRNVWILGQRQWWIKQIRWF